MGVASFILALLGIISIVLMFTVIQVAHASFQVDSSDTYSPFHYMLGTWTFVTGLMCVCGIVFGIGGVRQARRRHSMAVLGLCMNIGVPVGLMFFMMLAMTLHPDVITDKPGTPVVGDPPWFSAVAPVFTGLAVAIAFILGLKIWKKRSGLSKGVDEQRDGTIVCPMCKKEMPSNSKFCRRCGADIALAMLKFGQPDDLIRGSTHTG